MMKATRLEERCPKCEGTGLLPFVKPDGTASLYAQVFCDCHPVYGENAYVSMPLVTEGRRPGIGSNKLPHKIQRGRMHLYIDDFDFPMSYSCYRGLCQQHGWQDPGSCELPEEHPIKETIEPVEVKHIFIYEHSNISNREIARIFALENNYSNLKKVVNERLDKKKRIDII